MESYLRRLREVVGSDLLISPAVQMVVVDADQPILYERRRDNGLWGIPSGVAEPGSSLAATAVTELREEVGLIVDEADLVAFGTLSESDLHTFTYPNGDQLHAFSGLASPGGSAGPQPGNGRPSRPVPRGRSLAGAAQPR